MIMQYKNILVALGLILFALVVRLVFHLPDATPITAIALVSGFYLGRSWAVIVPLVALFLSDLLIGFYDWRVMLSVYGSFALIGALSYILKKYPTVLTGLALTATSSLLFFIVTNFAVWAFSPWYAKSLEGLLYCYTLGLPFYRNMFLGDALYTPLLFGVFVYGSLAATHARTMYDRLAQVLTAQV